MRKYKLTRSKRKTLGIKINEDASLEVKAPINISQEKIDEFVQSKEKWIAKHTKEILERYEIKKQFTLNYGGSVSVRGKPTEISRAKGEYASYDHQKSKIYIPKIAKSPETIKLVIVKLYKLIAKNHINQRVSFFGREMNVNPTAVRITSAKTRWGSCSGKNSVNFSWRLIMADDETIDYVVVHELAHIKEHNHSPKFWNIVESIFPDYKKQKEKLKILSEKLSKEDWD